MTDLQKAKSLLNGDVTCALCKGERVYLAKERGVKPLLAWIDSGEDFSSFAAADKVVGKAAAFLYALMKVDCVYAKIISTPALQTLNAFGIKVEYGQEVPAIRNRANTGFCPMETAVWNVDEPRKAYQILKQKTSV
jgi:hypothetical protein